MNKLGLITMALFFSVNVLLANTSGSKKVSKIDGIELYLFNVEKPLHFSFGTWHNRQHVFVRLVSGKYSGWSEHNAGRNNLNFDLEQYAEDLKQLKGLELHQALSKVKEKYGEWDWGKLEVLELALYDLIGKVEKKNALEMLGLKETAPIPGLFCVLEEDPTQAEKQAKISLQHNFKTHIKVKIFGKLDLDKQLISEVRRVMGPDTYITADVNTGYKNWTSIDELKTSMLELNKVGLNACEDPAKLEIPQWVELQKSLPEMAIIPDYIMRPSWETLETAVKGMGDIYNLHPHCMGSIHLTTELATKIKNWDAKLMIGDASLIGPACSQWQQIAIGLGADWVEALEKPDQSGKYMECVKSLTTYQNKQGKIAMKPEPGFGIKLNIKKVKELADKSFRID
jgi:L-alanine-DL-glutamate epimerase-like enolase superfamily enzyme